MTVKKTTKNTKRRPRRTATKKGEGIANLIPYVLPILKKVLPVLGMAAATVAISGATSKAVQGKGMKRKPGRPRKPRRPRKVVRRGDGLLLGSHSPFRNVPLLNILL